MTRASESNAGARNTDRDTPSLPSASSNNADAKGGHSGGGDQKGAGTARSGGAAGRAGSAPPGVAAPPPGSRQPLPGPPPRARMPGAPPMPGAPRFAPPPPRRPQLTGAQRGRLTGIAALIVLLGAAIGFVVSLVLPTQYAARTSIQYNIAGENTGTFLKTDRNLTTQVVLMTSRNVLQPVADANGISVDDLSTRVTATILNASDIIQLEVRDPTREVGTAIATAIAKRYLDVAAASGPKGYLQAQLDAVKRQQSVAGTNIVEGPALAARAAALQSQLDDLNLTSNQSSIIVPAYSVDKPVSPNPAMAAITGGVCGLVVALVTIITLGRRWTRS